MPGVLAGILIWPVAVLTKTSPAGTALNVPPGLFMTGAGLVGLVVQNDPEGYWNWGLTNEIIDIVTNT